MSVAFSSDIFQSQKQGGISRYFAELQRQLRARRYPSVVLAGLHANLHIADCPRVLGWYAPSGVPFRLRTASARAAEALWQRLAPANALFHKSYFRGTAPAHRKVVLTVYDMIHERYPSDFAAADPTTARKRDWCNRADLILSISHSTKRDLVEIFGIADSKIVVTHLGVRARPVAVTAAATAPYFVFVGGRAGYKNFDRLLEALARSRPAAAFRLIAFGGGPPSDAERRRIDELGLTGRVDFTGGDDDALARLYAGATALAYPSQYEGFGLPPVEAMAQSCPVICSTGGSLQEVVGDAALIIDPLDTDAIADALGRIISDSALRADLTRRGRVRASLFTWERTADATLAAYRQLGG
ncbi:MAG TPA: glycosyltransferase family 1 protein [Polyangia bacterium]